MLLGENPRLREALGMRASHYLRFRTDILMEIYDNLQISGYSVRQPYIKERT